MSGAADPLLSTSDLEDFDEDGHPEELRPGDVPSHVAKRYKTTLYLSWLACVVCFVDLSIVSPTLYPYVAKLCGSTTLYGYLMMVYSGCQVIASPLFNTWAVKRTVKEAMLGGLFCLIVGNLVYALASLTMDDSCAIHNGSVCIPLFVNRNVTNALGHTELQPVTVGDAGNCGSGRTQGLYILFIGRALAGLGGGAISVAFGLFPRITRIEDRVYTYGCARTYMALAYMMAPGLAAVFALASCSCQHTAAGFNVLQGSAYINQFTLPGYATSVMAFAVFVAVLAQFENPPSGGHKQTVKVFLNRGLCVLLLSSFLASFVTGAFSAILVPVTSHNYDWGDLYNSLFFVGVGLLLIPGSAFVMIFAKKVSPRAAVVTSSCILAAGLFCDLFPTAGPKLRSYIPFFMGSFLICSGYAAVTAVCPATFSMLIPPSHRQIMMGWMPALNGIARALGPLYGVQTYVWAKEYGGPCAEGGSQWEFICGDRFTEVVLGVVVLVGAGITLLCWNHIKVEGPPPAALSNKEPSKLSMRKTKVKTRRPSFIRSASELLARTAPPPGMGMSYHDEERQDRPGGSRPPVTSTELLSQRVTFE